MREGDLGEFPEFRPDVAVPRAALRQGLQHVQLGDVLAELVEQTHVLLYFHDYGVHHSGKYRGLTEL